MRRLWTFWLAAFCIAFYGCEPVGCLGGKPGCRVRPPCEDLRIDCAGGRARARVVTFRDELPGGLQAEGVPGDVLIANERVAAVIEAIGHPHYLGPSGGNLLDLATRGGDNDGLGQLSLATGILPADAVRYERLEILEAGPEVAAVQVAGHLAGYPDALVATRYEIRPCDPGVRIRTEIVNLAQQPGLWPLLDTFFWGGRETQPFVPVESLGFDLPSLDLEHIDDTLFSYPFMAAAGHAARPISYAVCPCRRAGITGLNSDDVSAMGLGPRITPPGDYRVYERFLVAADGAGIADAADVVAGIRNRLFGETSIRVSGRVMRADGTPAGGNETHASVHITGIGPAGKDKPLTQVVPDATGHFHALVPAGERGPLRCDVWAFGRVVASVETAVDAASLDAGDLVVPVPASLEIGVTIDGAPADARLSVQPADAATREQVRGRLNGRFDECAPLLGNPYGPSPACNQVLVPAGGPVGFTLPAGTYHLYATAGPFASLARTTLRLEEGARRTLGFSLAHLDVAPAGALSADLHVHSGKSYDTVFPLRDRVDSILAAGIEVVAATEHDITHDYADALAEAGAAGRVVVMPGTEATGYILFLDVPGRRIPACIGHWNFWPLVFEPDKPRGGVPWTQLAEPGELFERMQPHFAGEGVIQLNHPWESDFAGRDQGWPRALELDLHQPLPPRDDGSAAGLFRRIPGCSRSGECSGVHTPNHAYHVQEVINGTRLERYLPARSFWFYLLRQGIVRAGTANSDSHYLTSSLVGSPRNLVFTATTVADFAPDVFNRAVRTGRMLGTNGPVLLVAARDASGHVQTPSTTPFVPAADALLHIEVRAAPWIPVDEIRVYVDGTLARTVAEDLVHPADPFGTGDILRYRGALPLASLLPPGDRDAFVVVEAGTALPLAADLNGDGVPDTSDNDGNGRVDLDDVDPDERGGCEQGSGPGSCGPLRRIPLAADGSDPRAHFDAVFPGSYPLAFANPLLLDRDRDGVFSGPGLGEGGSR